jgi:hypothetical protein
MLSEGRQELASFKKGVEQTVGDVRAIYSEITGLWGWLKGLFGAKSKPKQSSAIPPVKAAEPKAAAARKEKPEELSYEQYQAKGVHDICDKLKQFFEIKRQLKEHCHKLEEESKITTDIEGAALDRIQIEMQLEQMTVQIRECMIYTPKELGLQDIYGRFLKMYEQILEEREYYRQLKAKQARDEKWRLEYRNNLLKAKLGYAIVMGMAALWMTGLFSALCGSFGCGSQ